MAGPRMGAAVIRLWLGWWLVGSSGEKWLTLGHFGVHNGGQWGARALCPPPASRQVDLVEKVVRRE